MPAEEQNPLRMLNSKVTDGELEWLQKDVEKLISADMVTFLVKIHEELAQIYKYIFII